MYDDSDNMLREGLEAIALPPASRDFDARVLCRLSQPGRPSIRQVFETLRPALVGAVMSLPLMLGLTFANRSHQERRPPDVSAGVVEVPESVLDHPQLTPSSIHSLPRFAGVERRPVKAKTPRASSDSLDNGERLL